MAANLSAPGQFGKGKSVEYTGNIAQALLPPSSFKITSPSDPWKDLAKATGEILHLKSENLKLREQRHVTIPCEQAIQAKVDIHSLLSRDETVSCRRHLDDIISNQAADITELRKKLAENEAQRQQDIVQLQSQLLQCNTDSQQKVTALEKELLVVNSDVVQQAKNWEIKSQQLQKEWLSEQEQLNAQLHAAELQHEEEIDELHRKIKTEALEFAASQSEMQENLRNCKEELSKKNSEVLQLKKYIGESEQMSKSSELWRKEILELKSKLQICEDESNEQQSSVVLLNVQLKSLRQIFELQENDLTQHQEAMPAKKKTVLLTRWREKVFELMVRLATSELVQKDEHKQWLQQLQDSEASLQTCRCDTDVLKHSLVDTQAQLELSQAQNKRLQEQLTQAQQLALTLDDERSAQQKVTATMAEFVYSTYEKYRETEASLQTALGCLKAYQQRIAFASGRVQMLQAQFARKEAMLRLDKAGQQEEPTSETVYEKETEDSEMEAQVCEELNRVTSERDALAAQIKADALRLDAVIAEVKAQVAGELSQLQKQVDEQEAQLNEKTVKCHVLSENLQAAEMDAAEAKETIEKLKTDLAKVQLEAEQDIAAAKHNNYATHSEQITELEHKVNEARREHAKAVVCVRQMERQATRASQRYAEQTQQLEDNYKLQMAALNDKLRVTEADRNLIMTTLKQEGLIGKYKSLRPSPQMPTELELAITQVDDKGDRPETNVNKENSQQDGLHTVIADLKDLTAAVMADSE